MSRGETVGRRRRQGGFVMIEALVAIGILGVTLVLVHGALVGGWRSQQRAASETVALGIAKALLREAGISTPLGETSSAGSTDGYEWRVDITRYVNQGGAPARPRFPAWWVAVDVRWKEAGSVQERNLTLNTLKLGPAP